jgi:hypothetical protein
MKGLLWSVYKGQTSFSQRTKANSNRLIFFFSILCAVASLLCRPFICHAADQGRAVSPNHRRRFDDRKTTCTGAGESGFWEVLYARPLEFFFNTRRNH